MSVGCSLSSEQCDQVWERLCEDIVRLRVNPGSPFSEKYWNVSRAFADEFLLSLEFLMLQVDNPHRFSENFIPSVHITPLLILRNLKSARMSILTVMPFQPNFSLSAAQVADRLYMMLPVGLLARSSSRPDGTMDPVIRLLAPSPDAYHTAWQNPGHHH